MTIVRHNKQMFILSHNDEVLKTEEEPLAISFHDHGQTKNRWTGAATGSPSSNYKHRRASVLLRNIRNIRICMGKKPIVFVKNENKRISIKNSLPYIKCVLRLSCVV